MTDAAEIRYEKFALRWAVTLAIALHLGVGLGLVLAGQSEPEEKYKPLAVMDFAHYDPDGGEPGGADNDEVSSGPESVPEPAPPPEPEPIPEPEPEPEPEIEPEPAPEILESLSEKAEVIPPPPPKEEPKPVPPKPKEKPKPKPKPKPVPAKETNQVKSPGGGAGAEIKQGGGGPGTGKGGVGGGKGTGNPNALNAYTSQIRRRLERYKKYPPAAQAQKLQGTATVSFTVDRNGSLRSPRLVKSSGHKVLDEEVMALLLRAAPMPAFPKELTQNSISLTVPIRFSSR